MDLHQKSRGLGAAVIFFALALRLISSSAPAAITSFLSDPKVLSAILFMETGRVVTPQIPVQPDPTTPSVPPDTTPPETTPATEPEEEMAQAVFSPGDASLVDINSVCGYDTDLATWLQQPLQWDLTTDEPTVLILHTHGSESYKKTEDYKESSDYRTLNNSYNMVSVGEVLAQTLEAGGIHVVHDKTLHDYPSFSSAYGNARSAIKECLKKYPSIKMVLDLHRDAVSSSDGKQPSLTTKVNGQKVAQLMLVVGTDANGLAHPDWPENMALAVKLHAQLEKRYPGICRPISFRKQRFNQDLSAGAMIIEIGAAGNNRSEALLSAQLLGETILTLSNGAKAG